MAEKLGITFGTFYTHGMRNLSKPLYQGKGDSVKLRTVTIRSGLVYRIG